MNFDTFDDALKWIHMDLMCKHRQFARDRNEEARSRVFDLLDEMEWVYPQLKETKNG